MSAAEYQHRKGEGLHAKNTLARAQVFAVADMVRAGYLTSGMDDEEFAAHASQVLKYLVTPGVLAAIRRDLNIGARLKPRPPRLVVTAVEPDPNPPAPTPQPPPTGIMSFTLLERLQTVELTLDAWEERMDALERRANQAQAQFEAVQQVLERHKPQMAGLLKTLLAKLMKGPTP